MRLKELKLQEWTSYRYAPSIRGRPARSGCAYTYVTDDDEIELSGETVRDFTYDQLKRKAIIQGRIKVCELEMMLLTHVTGRVIHWSVWAVREPVK